jgi:arylsulfatase A-like enzyme
MNGSWGPFKQAPNLLILLTDQQRTAQHLPAGWVQQNLPNLWSLMQGGVTFPNAMTNTTACSPSRATLWTSTFPMINGVDSVGETLNMSAHDNLTTLGLALARYAPAGVTYNIAYKGKWHLDADFESGQTLAQQQTAASRASQLSNDQTMASRPGRRRGGPAPRRGARLPPLLRLSADAHRRALGTGHVGDDQRDGGEHPDRAPR